VLEALGVTPEPNPESLRSRPPDDSRAVGAAMGDDQTKASG